MSNRDTVTEIKARAARGLLLSSHALDHMMAEGFTEGDIREALAGRVRVLESYPDRGRVLVLGYYRISARTEQPIHVVCDVEGDAPKLDVTTAYHPTKPEWASPTARAKRR